jgi:hypothetical protein
MAGTTPLVVEPANRAAQWLINSLVDLSSGTWTGLLPKPRISPPLMLGDCPVKDHRTCSGDRRTKPTESSQSFQISNSVAMVQAQSGEINEPNQSILIQYSHSWARFHLSKALGCFWHGKKPYLRHIDALLVVISQPPPTIALCTSTCSSVRSPPWLVMASKVMLEGTTTCSTTTREVLVVIQEVVEEDHTLVMAEGRLRENSGDLLAILCNRDLEDST